MKINEFKRLLEDQNTELSFYLPNGQGVPAHYHLTEIGHITKRFIDCGGTERKENKVSFQLWVSIDTDHRLDKAKLLRIIEMAEEKIDLPDAEIEIQYQGDTIKTFALDAKNNKFMLRNLFTDCLAKDNCGIPIEKIKKPLSSLSSSSCCSPNSACC